MIKDDHFPNVGFVCQAFLYSIRFLVTHPVSTMQASLVSELIIGLPDMHIVLEGVKRTCIDRLPAIIFLVRKGIFFIKPASKAYSLPPLPHLECLNIFN